MTSQFNDLSKAAFNYSHQHSTGNNRHYTYLACGEFGTGLASQSRHIGSSGTSVLFMNKENMTPGQWLGSVLGIPFNAFTLMLEWQEGHPVCK